VSVWASGEGSGWEVDVGSASQWVSVMLPSVMRPVRARCSRRSCSRSASVRRLRVRR